MKLRGILALVLMLVCAPALAQVTPGTSPLSGAKGGTNNAFMQFTGPATSLKTYTLPNASGTLAMLAQIQTWTAAQSFSDGTLILLGSSSGSSTIKAPATGGGVATLFPGTDTVAGISATQALTNKTFNCASNTCTVRIASDVSGLGTGVATALGTNVGLFGSFVVMNGVLGTPSSGTINNGLLAAGGPYTFKCNNTGGTATPTDCDVTAFTSKGSPVGADLVLIQDSAAGNAFKKTTVGALASAGSVASINQQTGALVMWPSPQGRLTLTSGTPVMATSVAAATTVFYTAYAGKFVPIYNGTAVALYPICAANTAGACEQSIVLGSNWVANINYDFFDGLNSGTPTLCTGPAWTSGAIGGSDVLRGTGAGSTELQQFDGLNTNKNSMTCRYNNTSGAFTCAANQCTYLGTCRMSATGQTQFIYGASAAGGTAAAFNCWNANNRVNIRTTVTDTNTNWNYPTATIRPADNSTGNRASFISGLSEDGFSCQYTNRIQIAASALFTIGCALDSTTVFDRKNLALNGAGATTHFPVAVKNDYNPVLGWHFVQALELGDGTNNNPSAGDKDESFIFEFSM